jgi:Ni/Fe-hydrogenase subunit HybB-like protein
MTTVGTPPAGGFDQSVPAEARKAVLRPFGKTGWFYKGLLTVLSVVVLVGLYAFYVQLREGMGVAGYNNRAFWAIYIADAITFIGVSYGGAVISAVLRLTGAEWRAPLTRLAEGMAVVTVLVGTALIVPHLGRPLMVWKMLTQPNISSPELWDFIAVTTYIVGSIVFFVLPLVPDMAIVRNANPDELGRFRLWLYKTVSRNWVGSLRQRKTLRGALGLISVVIIPLAVSVHSVLSWDFSLVTRPWWHESIWAPYFVVAALYSGVALVILVVAAFRRAYHLEAIITQRHFVRLGFIMAAFAATYLYLTFADMLPGAYVDEPATASIFYELIVGRYAVYFWTFFVGGGLLPLLLVALPWTRNVTGMVIAAAVVIPSMWLKRMLMVVAPANFDRVTEAFGDFRPTWVSGAITLAAVAAVPLGLMLLFRVVPLVSIEELDEVSGAHDEPGEKDGKETGEEAGKATEAAEVTAPQAAGTKARRVADPGRPSGRRRWLFRAAGSLAVVGLAVGALGLGGATPASAADKKPVKKPAVIALTGQDTGKEVQLTATVTVDNKPLPKVKVDFQQASSTYKIAKFVPIGTVTTDAKGVASLMYKSPVDGSQNFTVKFAGDALTAPATANATVDVQKVQFVFDRSEEPALLSGVGRTMVGVLLGVVVVVWLTLIAQVIRVWRVTGKTATS